MNEKENSLITENSHQKLKSNISKEKQLSNDVTPSGVDKSNVEHSAMSTNHTNHVADSKGHHDHDKHPHAELEQDHTHILKQKTKRHWNMQRMIKPKTTEP
jgi:hypothetical protein